LLATKGEDGATLLHMAAFQGRRSVAELLLARHAAPDARSAGGSTALHLAARLGVSWAISESLRRSMPGSTSSK
jgi:ankyrin repeat protein